MILIVDRTDGRWQGWVFDNSHGVPISGASVGLRDPSTKRYVAETVTSPNGDWSLKWPASPRHSYAPYTLEVICGAEKVTIDGDQVYVEVPESRRKVSAPWYRRLWHWPCDETCRWRA